MIKLRGYISSRKFMEERVPQHIQNFVIREFCKKNNFHYLLSIAEYAIENSFIMLHHALKDFEDNGIVAYSLFQMPIEDEMRLKFFNSILKKNKVIYFCVEQMKITNQKELIDIENIWLLKKALKNCPSEI